MKVKKMFWSMMAFAAALTFGLTSCEPGTEPSKGLAVSPTSFELQAGKVVQVKITEGDAANAKWSIDNEAVATLQVLEGNAAAKVTGVSKGVAVITVTVGDAKATSTITVTGEKAEDQPAEPAIEKGNIGFMINIPIDYPVCNGIAMIGGFCSFDAAQALKFELMEGTKSWYYATIPTTDAATFGNSKITLVGEDGTTKYDYCAVDGYEILTPDYAVAADDYGTANAIALSTAGAPVDGVNIIARVMGFKASPCVPIQDYTITLKMAYKDAEGVTEYGPAVSGFMNGWGVTAMEKVSDTEWKLAVGEARQGQEFKFQSTEGGWANEIMEFKVSEENPEGEWVKLSNLQLKAEANSVYDFSDPAKYKWAKDGSVAIEPNPAGDVTVTVTATNLPAGAKLRVVGNITAEGGDNHWNKDAGQDLAFDEAAGVYKATFAVVEKFEFKVLWSADGAAYDWNQCALPDQNIKMDSSMESVLEISEWKGVPAPVE